jgi:hypothetical protein
MTGTVTRLPTAAARKVRQGGNRQSRAAARVLREQQPWPGRYIFPSQREAFRRIAVLREMEPSPAVNLVRNIIDAPTGDAARRVIRMLQVCEKAGDPLAKEAVALLHKTTGTTFGELNDFAWAMAQMAKELAQ